MYLILALYLLCVVPSLGLDNGLARTPPMLWTTWERYMCDVDCKDDPGNCIGEKLIKDMADRMVADGYKDVGYEYVNVDDCWTAANRTADGRLQPDPARFPSGIKALADYVHSKGLKFGIYGDMGTKTCAGYLGSEYYLEIDAQTFADWGVDYLMLDGCNSDPKQFDDAYPAMSMWLNQTGRPIMFSCSWPAYWEIFLHKKPDYVKIAKYCNLWRNYNDIYDSWDSVYKIINWYGDNATSFAQVAGPGHWNDPDMLIIGDFGLSWDQSKAQMGMWAIMASPLKMSMDLRTIDARSKALLQNKRVIAINQDRLGIQGTRIIKNGVFQVWTRPLVNNAYAFAFLLTGLPAGPPKWVSVKLSDMRLNNPTGYTVTEGFEGTPLGKFMPADNLTAKVNPTGIFLAVATPVQHKLNNPYRNKYDAANLV